ncbi:site-specific integrase [bacterium]|nr:site-specific integrase [bacterium]
MKTTQEILNEFYSGKSIDTIRAYQKDLESFSQYMGTTSIVDAIDQLLSLPDSQANLTVLYYRTQIQESGLSISSINRRISSLRSLAKKAYKYKAINWLLDLKNIKTPPQSSKREMDAHAVKSLFSSFSGRQNSKKEKRDLAILRLLYDLALKRGSVVQLDMEDLKLRSNMIFVTGLNGDQRRAKRLPPVTKKAIQEWITVRGEEPGPLFVNFDHAKKGKRLSSTSVYRIVKEAGKQSGLSITPDELRQAAIKEALKNASRLGIEDKDVLTLTDHKSVTSLKRYLKNREEIQETLSISLSEQN